MSFSFSQIISIDFPNPASPQVYSIYFQIKHSLLPHSSVPFSKCSIFRALLSSSFSVFDRRLLLNPLVGEVEHVGYIVMAFVGDWKELRWPSGLKKNLEVWTVV